MKNKDYLLKWDKTVELGIVVIDSQHKRMFEIVNKLYKEMKKSLAKNDSDLYLADVLMELLRYGVYHFETEEKYFKEFKYKGREKHEACHRAYQKKIASLVKGYVDNKATVSIELLDYLEDWWVYHIKDADRKYVKCFKDNGLK